MSRVPRNPIAPPVARATLLASALLLAPPASARSAPQATLAEPARAAQPAQPQPAALDARLDELCAEIERQRVALHVPGLALAVVKDDQLVLARGFGLAELETRRPVTPETLFAIGSTTKAFTATLVAMLAEEGALGLDEPVAKHLPWFTPRLDRSAAGEDAQLTLRDLLCHRWGHTRMGVLWAGNAVSRETVLRTAARAEPWAPFRAEFHYSNVGFLAAGEAVAAAAGASWDELLRTRLLVPLGMSSTTTSLAAAQADERLAAGYAWSEERGVHERLPMRALDAIAPAGALNSNALDLAHWVRFQLGGGTFEGERLLGEEALRATWEPQIDVGGGVRYALGWMVRDWNGHRVIEHGGNIDGFAAEIGLLPDDDAGWVLLANVTATPLQATSLPLVCEALLGESGAQRSEGGLAAEASAKDFSPYLGTYVGNFAHFHDARFEVLERNGRLALDVPGQMVFELEPPDAEGQWSFALPVGIAIEFERDETGRVIELILHQSGYAFELPREGVEIPAEVPLAELAPFLGSYRDSEGTRELNVLIQNNRLALDVPGQMVFELRLPDADGLREFRITPAIAVEFHADEATGAIVSLTMHEKGEERLFERSSAAPAPFGLAELNALRRPDERLRLLEERGPTLLRARVRLANSGVEGTTTLLVGDARRYRSELDLGPFGHVTTAVDGEGGWSEGSFARFQRLEGLELAFARAEHPWCLLGDWRLAYDEVEVQRAEQLDGRGAQLVRLRHADEPAVQVWVDEETGDVLKSETWAWVEGMGALRVTSTYSDYRELDGLRLPFRVEARNDASGLTVLEVESLEPVTALAPDAFDPPPRESER